MDCIIPHHSVRMFCSAIGACSKIGKDIYVDFDPIDGLCLRTLNEAKSAYVCFRFQSSFFERCTAPPLEILQSDKNSRKRNRSQQSSAGGNDDDESDQETANDKNNADDENRLTCRLAIKALSSAVRQRKNVNSLRLYTEQVASSLHLSFEYLLSPVVDNWHDASSSTSVLLRVVHRVPVADFPVSIVSAVSSAHGTSELRVQPRTFLRLLEPLARQAETALVVPSPQRENQMVATCFQHAPGGSGAEQSSSLNNNALLTSHLQTEMRLSYDDVEEMEFVDNRNTEHDDDADSLPEGVNESVALVFSHREAKAILQWASSSSGMVEVCQSMRVLFHWGGRPLVFEQQTPQWKVELVLATLDHKLLGTINDTSQA